MLSENSFSRILCIHFLAILLAGSGQCALGGPLSDILWVWGNPEMGEEGTHTAATFAQAKPLERAQLLGTSNVILAGLGLPSDPGKADALSGQVDSMKRVVWEISPDDEGETQPFTYQKRLALLEELLPRHPNIEGVLLDDMSTVAIDKGFKPDHIRQIRQRVSSISPSLKTWGVVYTMSLDRPGIEDYIRELDVISLWVWHAKDIPGLETHVAYLEKHFPGKPIVLGLYLYDYGNQRRMPADLLDLQFRTALKLAKAGRIQGLVFLTINNDQASVERTAGWINQVRDELVPDWVGPDGEQARLSLGDGSEWVFSGQPWTEDAEGLIRPPDLRNLHSRAFSKTQAFSNLVADFEFNGDYRETGTGSAGLILRASDPNHFYYVYFPWGGQQLRAKNFWAAIAKVEGDGYLRHLKMVWVPGVPSETDRWYRIHVTAQDERIAVTVDGRKALEVTDPAFKSGSVGLAGYGWYAFRNLRISGTRVDPPGWESSFHLPAHAVPLALGSKIMPSGCVTPGGDIILGAGSQLLRSKDKGRTWGQPESLPQELGDVGDYGSTLFRSSKGRLLCMVFKVQAQIQRATPEIAISESPDDGLTWSAPVVSKVSSGWPEQPKTLYPYGPLLETQDGTLVRFLYGGVKEEGGRFSDVRTWSAIHDKAYAIRSTDRGSSWSAPIEVDQPSWTGVPRGGIPGSLDFTEPTGVAQGNQVMVLIRPVYSPTMWQCWSEDGGATWDSAARTTFPGYAQSLIRTQSGLLVCAHRYPHYAVNISSDGGLNWDEGTVIDYPVWAMGCLVEVEPNVLLCTYMNARQDEPLLAQLIEVTSEGVRPVQP